MDRPFNIVVVRLLRDEVKVAETIAKRCARGLELRSFLLLGGCDQHQGDG